ncbi:MAG: helix-hairpin-helix domain-containing protein, partial [Clostridia bacterium]
RNLRGAKQTHSRVMDIEGVGEKRFKILMKAFGSIENIKNANAEELSSIKGIDNVTAQNIVKFFEQASKK